MRAISLWNPWAVAIERLAKGVETRGWSTEYRGPLVIHASSRAPKGEMIAYGGSSTWQAALGEKRGDLRKKLMFGALLCVVDLTDVRPVEDFTEEELLTPRMREDCNGVWTEEQMGNYDPGRYGWVLENARSLREPVPWSGHQRFFNVPDEVVADLLEAKTAPWPMVKARKNLLL